MSGKQKSKDVLGNRCARTLKLGGFTQARFAHEIGLSQSYVAKIGGGSVLPTMAYLQKLSELCGVPLKALLEGRG